MSMDRTRRRKSPERPSLQRQNSSAPKKPAGKEKTDTIDFAEATPTFSGDTPKSQLEAERAALQKLQRNNDRLIKRLEEVTVRSATKEAEFRLKEREFRDRETRLLGELEKTEKEIARAKEEIRTQTAKIQARLQTKDSDFDSREQKKGNLHSIEVNNLKQKIEEAKKAVADTARVLELEAQVRAIQEEIRVQSAENRKTQGDVQEKQDEAKSVKEGTTKMKEKLKDFDDAQIEMSGVAAEKKRLAREAEDLQKEVKELQKEMAANEDEEDIWSLKGNLRDIKATCDDLTAQRDKITTQIERVKTGLTVDSNALSAIRSERRPAARETPARETTRETTRSTAVASSGTRTGALAGFDRSKYANTAEKRKIDEPTRQEKARIQELNASLKEYNNRTGAKNRVIQDLEKNIATQAAANTKTQTTLKALEADQIQLQKLIKQEKEFFVAEVKAWTQKVDLLKASQQSVQSHATKLSKALKDRQFELGEDQEKVKQVHSQIADQRTELRRSEQAAKAKEHIVARAEREFQGTLKTYRDTVDKLNDTEDKRANTQQILEETHVEFIETQKDLQSEIHTLEKEIYDQCEAKEFHERVVFELQKEVADLHWYFKPHAQKEPKESRIYGTMEFDLVVAKRKTMEAELEKVEACLRTISIETEWKRLLQADLQAEFQKILKEHRRRCESDEEADDFVHRIQKLHTAMIKQGLTAFDAITIVTLITKENFYPGVLKFLKRLVEKSDEYHFQYQIKNFLSNCYRAWNEEKIRDQEEFGDEYEPVTFRRFFLGRTTNLIFKQRTSDIFYLQKFKANVLKQPDMPRDQAEDWLLKAIEVSIFYGQDPQSKEEIEELAG